MCEITVRLDFRF